MKRRVVALFVLAAIIAVPTLATALPRLAFQKSGSTQTATSLMPSTSPNVSATTGAVVETTSALKKGHVYRIEVSGTWGWDTDNACAKADMAFTTTSCTWAGPTKTVRSLMIDGVRQSATSVAYQSSHVYSVTKAGEDRKVQFSIFDDNYTNNSGGLTVKIFEENSVTWEFKIAQQIPGVFVDQRIGPYTVTPGVSPTTVVQPITLPVPAVSVGTLTLNHDPAPSPLWCVRLQIGSGAQLTLACVTDPGRLAGFNALPDQTIPLGTGSGGNVVVCGQPPCAIPGVQGPPVTVDQRITGGIPPGSTLNLSFNWTANRQHLHFVGEDPFLRTGSSIWLPWNPTSSSEAAWFAANIGAVPATIDVQILDPSGVELYRLRPSVPGLGQVFEAMFSTTGPCVEDPTTPNDPICTG